jgi:hypothetical protein
MTLYKFKVSGRTMFPLDMLRHDQCWPANREDVETIRAKTATINGTARSAILLTCADGNTPARWTNFGWACGELERIGE